MVVKEYLEAFKNRLDYFTTTVASNYTHLFVNVNRLLQKLQVEFYGCKLWL
jgi:hypothetical protein